MPILSDIGRSIRERITRPSKEASEMSFWRSRARAENSPTGVLGNVHYERAFTSNFNLPAAFFAGKRVLDVGCGPRGSLEWAHMAAKRVGLDPLAKEYRVFGVDKHAMSYIVASAEAMPFDDGSFDIVSAERTRPRGRR